MLPFRNLSAEPENEFFADGITEDVIAQLSKIRSIKVISRTSVMPFKKRDQSLSEIGATLEVATCSRAACGAPATGSASSRSSSTPRRIGICGRRPTTGSSPTSSRSRRDVALQIAAALKAELSPDERTRIHREPTRNLNAYQLYLKGRHWYSRYTEEGFKRGIEYFEQAIAADPSYAMAHVGMGLAYAEFAAGQGGSPMKEDAAYRHGMAAITRALALDNSSARRMRCLRCSSVSTISTGPGRSGSSNWRWS